MLDSAVVLGAAAAIAARSRLRPEIGLIAGSGLSGLASGLEGGVRIPYHDIPGWPQPTVAGHPGELVLGKLHGRPAALACGRVHLYEGATPSDTAFAAQVLIVMGMRTLVVTNAAGSLVPALGTGDLMVISDHLFLPGMVGLSPLVGPNDDRIGPRFPSMAGAYDPRLRRAAVSAASRVERRFREGVYAMVVGPGFETPAEARMLRSLGADAVGMSTCPEVVVARHAGVSVLGVSVIANRVALDDGSAGTLDLHEEVTASAASAAADVYRVIEGAIAAA